MSRTIVLVGTQPRTRRLAEQLGRALGRRLITEPSGHADEVLLVADADSIELDDDLVHVKAPTFQSADPLRSLLDWAMAQGDVLTPSEHEQVMP